MKPALLLHQRILPGALHHLRCIALACSKLDLQWSCVGNSRLTST